MKFFIAAVFVLALAMGVQSSILPWPLALGVKTDIAGGGLSYTATSGPAAIALGAAIAPGAISLAQGPIVVGGVPAATVVAAPAAAVVAAPALGGAYVAKTLGAVHAAPLPGHIQSVANLNVAPAPGTL